MKFGKSLNNQIVETLPDWRDKFLSYKDLKKRLKQIGAGERRSKRQRLGGGGGSSPAMTPEEAGFVALLDAELDKFNAFFLEKEEDYVIRLKELHDRVVSATEMGSVEELLRVRKEIVDFHPRDGPPLELQRAQLHRDSVR
ncbi:SPX domain-containing protein 1-like isoform X2 [Miscanthus floridulus]|uniref:SPX domain-containing protein 1-like isoform X2 n=1 Tax=Miscanthus floridulus TaxID=154761 RepID=UPI0034599122